MPSSPSPAVPTRPRPVLFLASVLALTTLLQGCAERRIRVTSEPAGARVWLNDEEIGRTPCEALFTFYGKYDLRLEREGFEPYHAGHHAKAPLHEYPGPDLVAAALPADIRDTVEWHIVLTPTPESTLDPDTVRTQLIDRAAQIRERSLTTDARE
jgi:hypothetical protein